MMRVGGGEQLPNSSVNSHRGGPGDGGGGGEGGFGGGGDGGFDGGDGGFDGGGPSGEQEPQLRRQLTSMYPGFLVHSPELAQDAQLAGQASTHSDNARPFAATAATLNLEYAISASRGYATDEADIKASERSKPAVIFEIHCSGADQAADLAWLSCFPAEAECTLPSWSLLELTASRVYKERNLLILEVRPQLPLGGHVGEGKEGEPAVAGESVVARQLIASEWHECVGLRGLLRGARARNESWLLASLGRE